VEILEKNMKLLKTLFAALLCCALIAAAETPLFEKPRTYKQHKVLVFQMMQAVRAGNIEQMEEICRKGVELMPEDATWNYNLACALAYRADKGESLDQLEKSIELGFRSAEAIENDSDLRQLKNEPRFAQLIDKARKLKNQPVPGAPVLRPPTIVMGLPFEINPSNTVWNMDIGCFQSFCKLIPPAESVSAHKDYKGPEAGLLRSWLEDGTASGNGGDLYINRDRGHSKPGFKDFPLLTPVVYGKEGKDAGADRNLPNTIFEYPVVGNCSMAMTQGPYWRSLPRASMSDQFSSILQCQLYISNQLWVYPEHKDHDPATGDLFPVNAPFFTIVQGSSFKDKPFVRAYAAAMAALQPDTKRFLVSNKILAPVIQSLMRYSSNRIKNPSEYLSGKAHPVVFEESDLNVSNLVQMAHSLRPEEVVPPVSIQVIKEDQAVFGVDYFDRLPEALMNTPIAIGRVARGKSYERKMTLEAVAPVKDKAEFKWVLLQGDPGKVSIKTLEPDGSRVEISVGWHGWYRPKRGDGSPKRLMSSRVDIGCFLKGRKYYSAPSMVSIYYIPAEKRLYNKGRIISIDYNNSEKRYIDPMLSVIKPWKDLYDYTEKGDLKGWYRRLGDRDERFTWAGHRVMQSDRLNRPVKAVAVAYLPRQTGGSTGLPVMTFADKPELYNYTYKNDKDFIGEFAPAK
jgi:hypothetical protein